MTVRGKRCFDGQKKARLFVEEALNVEPATLYEHKVTRSRKRKAVCVSRQPQEEDVA